MTSARRNRGCVTAAEAVAMAEADVELQDRLALEHQQRLERAAAADRASKPVLDDLAAAGIEVTSVWNIYKIPDGKVRASPILVDHLERGGYPALVMEGMVAALDTAWVRSNWVRVVDLWKRLAIESANGLLAGVLAKAARRAQADDIIDIVQDDSLPESRLMFVGKVLRVGGERGLAVIESLKDDPVVGKEATARLKRRRR